MARMVMPLTHLILSTAHKALLCSLKVSCLQSMFSQCTPQPALQHSMLADTILCMQTLTCLVAVQPATLMHFSHASIDMLRDVPAKE